MTATIGPLLRKMLDDKALGVREEDGVIVLEERKAQMEVALTVGDAEVTPVHLAKFGVSRVADGPWKSSCDYLLVCEAASGTHVILVELKKTLAEEDSKAKEQLRRSLPLWRYLDALCLVEAGGSRDGDIPVSYVAVFERAALRFRKQTARVSARRVSEESYREIVVRSVLGTELDLSDLTGA